MGKSRELTKAGKAKKDEFYTQLTDIEKEMRYYEPHFVGKTIFCNCDDPEYSHFWLYFQLNFYRLGLKRLVSTHYDPDKPSYKMEIVSTNTAKGDGIQIGIPDYVKTPLEGNGDFRSQECIDILKEADIVVTNPPFSLFSEYLTQLVEYEKKFIIIGNINAISYREVFPLIMENKVWLGASIHSGDREFRVPDSYPLQASGWRVDGDGNKYIRVKGVRWFSNLDYDQRHEELILYKPYTPEEYPKYVNYDAIEVGKTADIPCDYYGLMGVPITFLDKYNPDQFEIVGNSQFLVRELSAEVRAKGDYAQIGRFYIDRHDGTYKKMYERLVIRRRHNED